MKRNNSKKFVIAIAMLLVAATILGITINFIVETKSDFIVLGDVDGFYGPEIIIDDEEIESEADESSTDSFVETEEKFEYLGPIEISVIEPDMESLEPDSYIYDLYYTLKIEGFSDVIASAICANCIAECGYNYELRPYITNYIGCYGICQWMPKYNPDVIGATYYEQVEYLLSTIEKEFNDAGWRYKKGFNFEAFMKMTSTKKAALAFAVVYEKCGSGSYSKRQTLATSVYKLFNTAG